MPQHNVTYDQKKIVVKKRKYHNPANLVTMLAAQKKMKALLPRQIQFDMTKILGKGSGGTCVFQGYLNGREVAVKRMLIEHSEVAIHEIDFI